MTKTKKIVLIIACFVIVGLMVFLAVSDSALAMV